MRILNNCSGEDKTDFSIRIIGIFNNNGTNVSVIESTNAIDVLQQQMSSSPNGNSFHCQYKRLSNASCEILTPFGFPVDPDVNIIQKSCSTFFSFVSMSSIEKSSLNEKI